MVKIQNNSKQCNFTPIFASPIFCPYCVFIVQNVYLYHRTHKNPVTGLFWGLFLNFRLVCFPFAYVRTVLYMAKDVKTTKVNTEPYFSTLRQIFNYKTTFFNSKLKFQFCPFGGWGCNFRPQLAPLLFVTFARLVAKVTKCKRSP